MKYKITVTTTLQGYHFTGDKLRNGDPIPRKGVWLRHKGLVEPCRSGLHMSIHPFDALTYAPGHILHKVELRGDLQSHGHPVDKWVGRERKITASLDCEELLRYFARQQALSVAHLWDAPDVVLEYLFTGSESLLDAAWGAAWGAALDAARDAALDAAWDAARGAARAAAWDAARAAAWDAALDAAWDAALDAAWDAARAAAWGAALDAARDAAWDAARGAALDAARDAAWDAARADFAALVEEAFNEI